MKEKRVWASLAIMVLVLVAVLALANVQVCREWAFVCEHTGSRKGYTEWMFGFRSGQWYRSSPLEDFIIVNDPNVLSHRWTSSCGTGRNILGMPILYGHGRPGAIADIDNDTLSVWIARNHPTEVWKLYDLFFSGNQDQITEKVASIRQEVLNY